MITITYTTLLSHYYIATVALVSAIASVNKT